MANKELQVGTEVCQKKRMNVKNNLWWGNNKDEKQLIWEEGEKENETEGNNNTFEQEQNENE